MQAPASIIVPRSYADDLARIRELGDVLTNMDFLLHHMPAGPRRCGGADDLARARERQQREMDRLLREVTRV